MSNLSPLTLYIDGGGTYIRTWVEIQPKDSLPPLSHQKSPIQGKIITLKSRFRGKDADYTHAVRSIKKFLKALPHKPDVAFIGFRGVWTPSEKKVLTKKFSWAARKVNAMSDIELSHRRLFKGKTGIVLNAGTGSIAYGKNEKGKTARAGGFGPLIGDEGSAFWIGRELLKARHSATSQYMQIRKIVVKGNAVSRIAGLAKSVLEGSDAESRRIRDEANRYLRDLIEKVRKELRLKKPIPLALHGGLFNNQNFRRKFISGLRDFRIVS